MDKEKYYKYKEKYLLLKNDLLNQIGGEKKVFFNNIEDSSLKNNYYRKVLFTTKNMQLVVMSLLPDENIPLEIHKDHDQFIKIEILQKGDCIIIPNNTYHEIKNIGSVKLKLFTIYTPPEHDAYKIDKKKPI
jgi:mannose-6-phosphate isomerase-like protein (cupin superfamily)